MLLALHYVRTARRLSELSSPFFRRVRFATHDLRRVTSPFVYEQLVGWWLEFSCRLQLAENGPIFSKLPRVFFYRVQRRSYEEPVISRWLGILRLISWYRLRSPLHDAILSFSFDFLSNGTPNPATHFFFFFFDRFA